MTTRPATVKLNVAEWTGLITAALAQIGMGPLRAAVEKALGNERAAALLDRKEPTEITKQDTIALVRAFWPVIPGVDRAAKTQWLIRLGRTVFVDDARFNEILVYINQRIGEYESANGEFDPVEPEPVAPVPVESLPFNPSAIKQAKNVVDYSRMEVVDLLVSADCDGRNHVRYNNALPPNWWSGSATKQLVRIHAVVEVQPGDFKGGHFDWCRVGQVYKTLDNLLNGYTGFRAPRGARIWFCLIANNAKWRTKFIESKTRFGG